MNLAGLKAAIVARVTSDTNPGGLWATGQKLINAITYSFEGRDAMTGIQVSMPYVAFDFPAMDQRDGYNFDQQEVYFRFHIWHQFSRAQDSAITKAGAIVDRLFGNALAATTRIPTYGFHRHQLTLTVTGDVLTPWATGVCHRLSSNESHEREALHFIETYRVFMTRVVAPS